MENKEVSLKVKFDDYKMVSNYIKNELGINKIVVNEMVEKMVEKAVGRNPIQERITRTIEQFVGTRGTRWDFNERLKEKVEAEMEQCIKKIISEEAEAIIRQRVREQIERMETHA